MAYSEEVSIIRSAIEDAIEVLSEDDAHSDIVGDLNNALSEAEYIDDQYDSNDTLSEVDSELGYVESKLEELDNIVAELNNYVGDVRRVLP